jgi:outer membrane protein assembly factor BamB
LNKDTGRVIWKANDERITHATPVVATIHGVRQVIFFVNRGLVSLNAQDGRELWHFPFRFSVSTASSPVVAGDVVYCSAGYGVGGGACQVLRAPGGFTVKELWKIPGDKRVANHWSTPVFHEGHLYGMFSFKDYGKGPLKCVELATGTVKWEKPGFGAGQIIRVRDRILALADDGRLVAVAATPRGYEEVGSFKAVEGKCWSTPALADGRVYLRSTREGACLELAAPAAAP